MYWSFKDKKLYHIRILTMEMLLSSIFLDIIFDK